MEEEYMQADLEELQSIVLEDSAPASSNNGEASKKIAEKRKQK